MTYGVRNRGDFLPHNEMKFWAFSEFNKGNYLKARKIFKVAERMRERFWASVWASDKFKPDIL